MDARLFCLYISTARLSVGPVLGVPRGRRPGSGGLHDARVGIDQRLEAIVDWAQRALGGSGTGVFLVARRTHRSGQGILMERYGIDGGQAFAYLARLTQQRSIKLRTVGAVLNPLSQLPAPTEDE